MTAMTCVDQATRTGMEWVGRTVMRGFLDPAAAADPTPAADPDSPVIVIGGFAATAPVMEPVADVLARSGHPVCVVTHGAGTGCAERAVDHLVERIDTLVQETGRRVHLVGHSRGGQFARVAAARRRASVASLTTLGTPVGLYGLSTVALGLGAAVAVVGSLGVPGLATLGCLLGACCARYRDDLGGGWPPDVPFTRITGRGDRTVPSGANVEPAAREVVLEATHLTLLTSPGALRAVSEAVDAAAVGRDRVAA